MSRARNRFKGIKKGKDSQDRCEYFRSLVKFVLKVKVDRLMVSAVKPPSPSPEVPQQEAITFHKELPKT
jgi:hypothetical protein